MESGQTSRKTSINDSRESELETSQLNELMMTRSRSIQSEMPIVFQVMKERDVVRMIQLKEQLLAIRERKSLVPTVPDPKVVNYFRILKETKTKLLIRQKLKERIEEKKKELSKLKHLYTKSELQFQEKNEVFKQKSALLRVLGGKMETELAKTKERYRQVQFNRVISQGVRKVLYYRLSQILFNQNARSIFSALNNINEQKDEDSVGNCLGYLTLFMSLVGNICGARMWINFTFRGPRSTIRLNDGTVMTLHPKDNRLPEAIKLLNEQICQMMRDTMQLKVGSSLNFYQMCEELSKQLLTIR